MSYIYTGPGWAQASSVPSRLYKGFTAEGGIRSPLIVSWPGQFAAGIHRPLATVRDIPSTILELAGIEHPGTRYAKRDILPMSGRSLLPVLRGTADAVRAEDEVIGWEQFGHRAVRRGDWKLTWIGRGFGPDRWQLYNLADDPAEARDLADQFPDKLAEMIGYWEDYRRENGVILPTAIDADPH